MPTQDEPKTRKKPKVDYVAKLIDIIAGRDIEAPLRECHFKPMPGQRVPYRFDLCWPSHKVAVEYQGIVGARHGYGDVGHRSLTGMQRDFKKTNEGQLHGWIVLQVSAANVSDGSAVAWIARALVRRSTVAELARAQKEASS